MKIPTADFAIDYAMKLGAEYAEARLESTFSSGFVLKNGSFDVSGFEIRRGVGIKILVNGSIGFASTSTLKKNHIKNLLKDIIRIVLASKRRHAVSLDYQRPYRGVCKVRQKIKLQDVSYDEKMGYFKDVEKELLGSGVDLHSRYFSFSDRVTKKYFKNSEGTEIRSEIPCLNCFYLITVSHGPTTIQRQWQKGNVGGWEVVRSWDLAKTLVREAKALKKVISSGVKAPKGIVDVVAGPEVTGIICHESCGHPYEADRIFGREAAQAGESFMSPEMLGRKVGSEAVTLVDDPTAKRGAGFYLYDDEGVKARRKILIDRGIATEFLHNRETAAQLGVKSNGSARASAYDREAIVRMSNTYMLPGDHTEEELVGGVKRGIYLKNFMEWNIDDKRMHQKYVGNEAYLIRNGKIRGPVKRPVIEIDTPLLYSSIDAVAKQTELHAATCGKGEPMQGIPVSMGGPAIRIKNIRLGGGSLGT